MFKSQRTHITSHCKRILGKESCSLTGKNTGNEMADALKHSLVLGGINTLYLTANYVRANILIVILNWC